MMNHPQRDNDPFWPTALVLVIAVFVTTIVILGPDGIRALFNL